MKIIFRENDVVVYNKPKKWYNFFFEKDEFIYSISTQTVNKNKIVLKNNDLFIVDIQYVASGIILIKPLKENFLYFTQSSKNFKLTNEIEIKKILRKEKLLKLKNWL